MVYQRTERTKSQLKFWQRLRISELGLRIVLTGIVIFGGAFYIVLANVNTTRSLELQDLNRRLSTLTEERSSLQVEVDRFRSLQYLDQATRNLDLVRVSAVDYVTSPTGSVAAR